LIGIPKGDAMKHSRRRFLDLAAGAIALPTISGFARAQTYPSRPVRIVVADVAGTTPDILARLIAQWLSERLGQQFIVENRSGGAGNLGIEVVVRAPTDGHTLLLIGPTAAINATLFDKLSYNFIRDIAPVASFVRTPYVMVVSPSFPAKTFPEFIAYAAANPGKLNFASAGVGTGPHVTGELLNMMAGLKIVHVPYRGGPAALTDLIAGEVQLFFGTPAISLEHIRAGRLRPLAVTGAMRWEGLPDIPAMGDYLPGFEASQVLGLGAPRRTPTEIIERLNKEIAAGLGDPKIKARIVDFGASVLAGSPADYGKLITDETEKWGKVIKFANVKPA
jgi:tripartite-type tricarboxylate transporter receptor subunit TctC